MQTSTIEGGHGVVVTNKDEVDAGDQRIGRRAIFQVGPFRDRHPLFFHRASPRLERFLREPSWPLRTDVATATRSRSHAGRVAGVIRTS